jgi:hypothetical protein
MRILFYISNAIIHDGGNEMNGIGIAFAIIFIALFLFAGTQMPDLYNQAMPTQIFYMVIGVAVLGIGFFMYKEWGQ